jgi:hypothetical protein
MLCNKLQSNVGKVGNMMHTNCHLVTYTNNRNLRQGKNLTLRGGSDNKTERMIVIVIVVDMTTRTTTIIIIIIIITTRLKL